MDSILASIKKLLGIDGEYTHFDTDVIMQINAVIAILTQLGVGPADGFAIEDDTATWEDFLGDDYNFEAVKSYIYLKVKLLFDPPITSAHMESMNKLISEFEWRLQVHSDPILVIEEDLEEE